MPRSPKLRSRFRQALIVVALLCIGLLAWAWLELPRFAERIALAQLRASGIEHVALAVEELSLNRTVVRSVALGDPPALEIDRVLIEYTLGDLLARHLDRLEVSDATLRVVFTPGGLSLGPLDALLAGGGAGAEGPDGPAISLGSAALRGVRVVAQAGDEEVAVVTIDAETPLDPTGLVALEDWLAALSLEATARFDSSDLVWGGLSGLSARGDVALAWSDTRGTLRADDVQLAFRSEGGLEVESTLDLAAELSQRDGQLRLRLPDCAEVVLASLGSPGGVSLAAPIDLCVTTGEEGVALSLAPMGAADLRFDVEASSDGSLRLHIPEEGGAQKATLRAPHLSIDAGYREAGLEAKLLLRSQRLDLPSYGLAAASLSLSTSLSASLSTSDAEPETAGRSLSGSVELAGLEIGEPDEPALLPLALDGSFALEGDRLSFRAVASEPRGVSLHAEGHHDLVAASGTATLRLEPLHFAADGLAPADVFPALSGWLDRASGAISADARFHWPSDVVGTLDLVFQDLDLESETLQVEGIQGGVRLDDVWPPRTPPGQFIAFQRLDSGLSLSQGALVFTLERDGTLDIAAAEGIWAGGWLKAKGRIDPAAERHEYALELKGIGLGPLSALAELEGLDATGQLTGTIPIRIDGKNIIIENARLEASRKGGTIRYRPAQAPAALSTAGEGGTFALEALRDFHYESLSVEVAGDAEEDLVVTLRLSGRNPAVSPQPINLNLTLRGPLGSLASDSLIGIWFPQRFIPALRGLRQFGSP